MVPTQEPAEPDAVSASRDRRPTARQVAAVYEVMRLLRRDRPDGMPDEQFTCDSCGRGRPRDGSVAYGESVLCNGCATDYELLRLARISGTGPVAETPSPVPQTIAVRAKRKA